MTEPMRPCPGVRPRMMHTGLAAICRDCEHHDQWLMSSDALRRHPGWAIKPAAALRKPDGVRYFCPNKIKRSEVQA
ncbi:MAG: hypothetical protein ACRC1H_19545 [Caldilineaceae bacterium]